MAIRELWGKAPKRTQAAGVDRRRNKGKLLESMIRSLLMLDISLSNKDETVNIYYKETNKQLRWVESGENNHIPTKANVLFTCGLNISYFFAGILEIGNQYIFNTSFKIHVVIEISRS